ncbi:hypothetical protein SAMN06272781_6475 [Streptomyces sp. 1222.2]|nr:hypothetical protein SAMN06272781_6475 [Streptomyces sp. 1222.2]
MSAPNTEHLGDQPSEAVHQVSETTAIGEVANSVETDHWLVIVDEAARPKAAVRSGALSDYPKERPLSSILADLPAMILAHADAPTNCLLPLLPELEPGSAVIVEHVDHLRVWAGPALHQIPMGGSISFPGPPHVPLIVKACRYHNRLKSCGHSQKFPTKPMQMPNCADPEGLGPHPFTW